MEARSRDHLSLTGIKGRLVSYASIRLRCVYILTAAVVGDDESEIMKLIRSVPKETEKA